MPSVLVETGFITNPQEEDYLNSEPGQQEIADCITKALGNYMNWLQKKQTPAEGNSNGQPSQTPDKPVSPGSSYSFLQAIEQQEKKRITK
jgi:N-acetylmuramoyl-L-alanine amidase